MFTIWICVFLSTLILGEGDANLHKYKKQWAKCSNIKPFLTHWNISMEKCVSECNIRKACLAVNYWERRSQCDMLLEDTENPLQQENNGQPCVFVKKADVEPHYNQLTCQACDDTEVCDIASGHCEVKECRQLLVPNATIKGNILSVGSKIRMYCNELFAQRPNETLSICQTNGTWSNVPTCHYLFACPVPTTIANAEVDTGTRAVDDVRYYTCNTGFISDGALDDEMFVQCNSDGDWASPEFECVAACPEPSTVANAEVDTGTRAVDDVRYYTCHTGFMSDGALDDDMFVQCKSDGDWTDPEFECVAGGVADGPGGGRWW